MEQIVLAARWPGLLAFALGGLFLLWRLLAPHLEPRDMLRWGRGRVEKALIPMVGMQAAPDVASAALGAGGATLLIGGVLLVVVVGPVGLVLAPLLALGIGWWVANRISTRRRERVAEQVVGLTQALAAGLTGQGVSQGTVFSLLRRIYRQMTPPLKEEFVFMELVFRGQADLGEALYQAAEGVAGKDLRALLELLGLIYQEALDLDTQRQALRTLLERMRRDGQVRRTVQIESRFGQTSQRIVLFLIPGFVLLAAVAGGMLDSDVSVADFYLHTLPGRLILLIAALVEGLVVWVSGRFMQRIRWS